ncbi:YqhA family protein [Ferrimonas lipolytica]|uniref:YqhA family protein n=1 Tax=Ferrimonas lipolytica TaxID=2724191 RepID=A0A6H1UAN0_9GAMM|nr:YqhA family protein [Ferrimonas lipolytica]QIZ75888.1 YqhA family protein [Ferrimonas lipolytica]
MERLFESLLWKSRLTLLLAVVSCVIAGIALIVLGISEVWHLLHMLWQYLLDANAGVSRDQLVLVVIEVLDTFLLSSVLFIFSFGLYELFVSRIEQAQDHGSKAFAINSIDQLKAKLGKVVLMLLVIKVFALLVEIRPNSMLELLYMALIVLLIALSLWLSNGGPKSEPK